MTRLFEGKRALVTEGGSGIGRATALALAAEGCFVTVAGRTESTLEETIRMITDAGDRLFLNTASLEALRPGLADGCQSASAARPPAVSRAERSSAPGGALVSGTALWGTSYQVTSWCMNES